MGMTEKLDRLISEGMERIAKEKEQSVLEQLRWFVDRGLLVIEETQPTLVQKKDGSFSIEQTVTLVSKEKDYIEKLEKDNALLNQTLKLYVVKCGIR